jgi:hypothetical protein
MIPIFDNVRACIHVLMGTVTPVAFAHYFKKLGALHAKAEIIEGRVGW